jgi:hypothetical protein
MIPNRPEDDDITTFRFACRKTIDVQITPLITPAARRLEIDIATNVCSLMKLSAENALLIFDAAAECRAYFGCANSRNFGWFHWFP